tara:strand:+ start:6834 stop:7856 length:1023 start_codon:yes stop_codon:yes gene_type:complete
MAKISVLMSVNNGERYLKQSIDSIIHQTFNDFEFIIINDGSNDDSLKIIKSYNDNRIKLINNKKRLGLTKSLNIGLKSCKSDIIARMDADDISKKDRFEKQYHYLLKNKDIAVLGGQVILIDQNDNELKQNPRYPLSNQLIKWELFNEVPFCHPSIFIRKEVFKSIGTYNEKYQYAQDYELWKRMVYSRYKFANLDYEIIYYRKTDNKDIFYKKRKQRNAHLEILTNYFKKNNFNVTINLVYYFRYGSKKILDNKKLLIKSVNLLIQLHKKFKWSNELSFSDKNTISKDTAFKLINFAKIQKNLSLMSRITILFIGLKTYNRIITHYQFRKTLRLILFNK